MSKLITAFYAVIMGGIRRTTVHAKNATRVAALTHFSPTLEPAARQLGRNFRSLPVHDDRCQVSAIPFTRCRNR